ncbi:MAG: hypothetical protein ACLP1Y_15470 [Candidatus Acidiferrales bacterium]
MKRARWHSVLLVATLAATAIARPAPQKKEYLSDAEADKIRDVYAPSAKIKLFITFAGDRVKRIQYELGHFDPQDHRQMERINTALNDYSGCIDDAAELIGIAVEKQQEIHLAVKDMQLRTKDYLTYLQQLEASGQSRDDYKDNLDDAVEATQDAQADAEKALKQIEPPPVRRGP